MVKLISQLITNGIYVLSLVGITLLTGCQTGVTFSDSPLNTKLPDDFRYRTLIKNSVEFRSDPASNIGLILTPDTNGEYHIIGKPVLNTGSVPQVAAFKDGQVYSAKVDAGGALQGSYLAITADLSSSNTMTIDIVDAVHAYVPPSAIPDDQLFAIAATTNDLPRYWLSDLYISTVTTTFETQESADASGSAAAYGAKGNVYAQVGDSSHDWVVAARLINVDEYAKAHGKPANGPIPGNVNFVSLPHGSPRLPDFSSGIRYAVLPPITLK